MRRGPSAVGQSLVGTHAVEEQDIPLSKGSTGPGTLEWVRDGETARPSRRPEVVHTLRVGAGGDLQPAEFTGKIVQRDPGGVGLGCSLNRNEVLMCRRCERLPVRKDRSSDQPWMRHHRLATHALDQFQKLLPVLKSLKCGKLVHAVIDFVVVRLRLDAEAVEIGNRLLERSFCRYPTPGGSQFEQLYAQRPPANLPAVADARKDSRAAPYGGSTRHRLPGLLSSR